MHLCVLLFRNDLDSTQKRRLLRAPKRKQRGIYNYTSQGLYHQISEKNKRTRLGHAASLNEPQVMTMVPVGRDHVAMLLSIRLGLFSAKFKILNLGRETTTQNLLETLHLMLQGHCRFTTEHMQFHLCSNPVKAIRSVQAGWKTRPNSLRHAPVNRQQPLKLFIRGRCHQRQDLNFCVRPRGNPV